MRKQSLAYACAAVIFAATISTSAAQSEWQIFEGRLKRDSFNTRAEDQENFFDRFRFDEPEYQLSDAERLLAPLSVDKDDPQPGTMTTIIRGQSTDGGAETGAADATDPSVPLTQFQVQNTFVPSTYAADGYSNVFVVQPVIPLNLNWDGIPYHIIRPTLPVISPTADPNGPLGVEGGLGDMTILDVYVHPIERLKTNIGVGPIVIAPTASHRQLGLGEWQLGPTLFLVSRAVPKWNLGFLAEAPFSVESDAYSVLVQPIVIRTLPDDWYLGVGDILWKFDDQNGGYDIPLSARVGKVLKLGDHLFNVFLQPQYTPRGFHSDGTAEWGIKLSVTLILPNVQLTDPLLAHDECRHCQPCCGH